MFITKYYGSVYSETTLSIDICFQRIYRCNKHIDSHIKFIAIKKERIRDISLQNNRLCKDNIF